MELKPISLTLVACQDHHINFRGLVTDKIFTPIDNWIDVFSILMENNKLQEKYIMFSRDVWYMKIIFSNGYRIHIRDLTHQPIFTNQYECSDLLKLIFNKLPTEIIFGIQLLDANEIPSNMLNDYWFSITNYQHNPDSTDILPNYVVTAYQVFQLFSLLQSNSIAEEHFELSINHICNIFNTIDTFF